MTGKEEYYKGTTCVKRGSKECVDALWRLALKDCAKEYWLGVRRMAEQVLDDLDKLAKYKMAYDILKKIVNGGYIDPEYGIFDSSIDLSEEEEEYVKALIAEEKE